MTKPLNLGIAGLGTVGSSLLKMLISNRDHMTCMAGRAINITAVSARNKSLDRGVPLDTVRWI